MTDNEDVISREHLLSGIDELMQSPWFNNGKDDDTIVHYGYVERKEAVEVVRDLCIKAEPSVTPKPRTGHWVKYAAPRCGEQHYKCTNCDDYVNFGQFGDFYTKDFKFCPHCGAKMEGEEDG